MKKFVFGITAALFLFAIMSCGSTGNFGKLDGKDYPWAFKGCTFNSTVADRFNQPTETNGVYVVGSGHSEGSASQDAEAQLAKYINSNTAVVELKNSANEKDEKFKTASVTTAAAKLNGFEKRGSWYNGETYFCLSFISEENLEKCISFDYSEIVKDIISKWTNSNQL